MVTKNAKKNKKLRFSPKFPKSLAFCMRNACPSIVNVQTMGYISRCKARVGESSARMCPPCWCGLGCMFSVEEYSVFTVLWTEGEKLCRLLEPVRIRVWAWGCFRHQKTSYVYMFMNDAPSLPQWLDHAGMQLTRVQFLRDLPPPPQKRSIDRNAYALTLPLCVWTFTHQQTNATIPGGTSIVQAQNVQGTNRGHALELRTHPNTKLKHASSTTW